MRVWILNFSRSATASWERGSGGVELEGVDCIVQVKLGIAVLGKQHGDGYTHRKVHVFSGAKNNT